MPSGACRKQVAASDDGSTFPRLSKPAQMFTTTLRDNLAVAGLIAPRANGGHRNTGLLLQLLGIRWWFGCMTTDGPWQMSWAPSLGWCAHDVTHPRCQ